jgi:hypothetical protein
MTTPTTIAREPIKVIADLLVSEMGLTAGQIMLSGQKWNIPKDNELYIALFYLPSKPIGSNNYSEPTPSGMNEIQEMAVRHMIQIDIMSFGENADSKARARKEEVLMALRSQKAQDLMGTYHMGIARIASEMVPTASLEETKYLDRYTTTIAVTALHRKVKSAAYYDTFQSPEVHSNDC